MCSNQSAHHADVDNKMPAILLDKNGVVPNYSYTHGRAIVHSGIAQ
jgi:hypothetical protein